MPSAALTISGLSLLDETLNWGARPLALLLRQQYEFPLGFTTNQFSRSFFSFLFSLQTRSLSRCFPAAGIWHVLSTDTLFHTGVRRLMIAVVGLTYLRWFKERKYTFRFENIFSCAFQLLQIHFNIPISSQ